MKDVMWNGYNAPYGQVEMLKSDFAGFSSVRIVKKKVASIQIHDYIETNNIIFTSIGGWRNGLPHQCGNVTGLGNIQPERAVSLEQRKRKNLTDSERSEETGRSETNSQEGE